MSGVALAALAGVGFGLFQAVNRRVNAVLDVYRATLLLLAVGSVLLGVIAILTEDIGLVVRAPMGALVAFAAAGFVHFFLGWTFLGMSQQRIGAARTGALLGTIPLFGTFAAAVLLGEVLTLTALAAVLVVVAGVAAVTLGGRPGSARRGRTSLSGVGFALATALCWSTSPLLIRVGLEGLASPLLGVTVGLLATTLVYGLVVAVLPRPADRPDARPVLGPVVMAGTFVGLAIWCYWTALDLAQVGVVLAVTQLSTPTVAIASPLLSGDPTERGGVWLWIGLSLIVAGSVTLLLSGR